ncbi:N-acetylmuramoyl-L-alanine amidase family protein, partial [Marinilactibacillus psychrotolerans]
SSTKLMTLAENGKNMPYSSTLYKQTINANTASEAWSKALEFKGYYPKDSRLSIAVNNAANRIFSMGQSSHRLGDFNTAMTYYKMLLIENKVDSQLRNVVSRYNVLAENGSKLLTVSGYVSNSKKASTASKSWNIALEGKLVFPNSSNINNAVEDAAQRLLKLARSYQRSGNKSGALTYYNMIINENAVLNDTKDLAHMYSKQLLSNFIPTVYIDPGHGGSDPGAQSSNVTEASLNLSTANYLKNYLESKGYNVVMSRNSNNFLSLAERAQEANELKVDAFVSIHYNAMGIPNSTASGIETYIYHRVASGFGQENNRDNFNTDNSRINESLLLADKTHANLISSTGLYNRGVKGNNFHVVRETNIPAVLYELGFMDNATELAKIRTSQYQKTAAQAIGKGIVQYFNQLK